MLDGPRLPPADGKAPKKLVILLHGYGADGDDLIGLAPHLSRVLATAAFLAPNAPQRCAGSPFGFQWWDIGTFSADERLRGAEAAAPLLNEFIDAELARYNLDESDLALIGFSQGTMMALHVGLRRERAVAGIVGLSGGLVGPAQLADEIRCRPPILLVHGDRDDMLPIEHMFEAAQGLAAVGVTAQWHVSEGTGHAIAADGLQLAVDFLRKQLADAGESVL